ncbi:MAG: hypothetical protein JWM93_1929, partial [Frankiales bacterium]|nr:hypothetical protein [Frankiales bacterium]
MTARRWVAALLAAIPLALGLATVTVAVPANGATADICKSGLFCPPPRDPPVNEPTVGDAGFDTGTHKDGKDGTTGKKHKYTTIACTDSCPLIVITGTCDGVAQADWDTCTGTDGCPVGQEFVQVQKEFNPGDPLSLRQWTTTCRAPGQPLVNPYDAVRHHLGEIVAAPVEATISPFNGPLPITLPVYLQVLNVPQQQPTVVTGAGYTLTMTLSNPMFEWYFDEGDPSSLPPTSARGGPYPTGTLQHIFTTLGTHTASVHVTWAVNYVFNQAGLTLT